MAYSREKTLLTHGDRIRETIKHLNALSLPLGAAADPDPVSWISYFEDIDPTNKKAYVLPMIRWFVERQMRYPEDASKAIPTIRILMRFSNRFTNLDLNTITFSDFLAIAEQMQGMRSRVEAKNDYVDNLYKTADAIHYHEDDNLLIVIPKSFEASQYFGRNTRWCTAGQHASIFDRYAKQGDLYILIFKKENRRWQFHFETGQFMDEMDDELSDDVIAPFLWEHFSYQLIEATHVNHLLMRFVEHANLLGGRV